MSTNAPAGAPSDETPSPAQSAAPSTAPSAHTCTPAARTTARHAASGKLEPHGLVRLIRYDSIRRVGVDSDDPHVLVLQCLDRDYLFRFEAASHCAEWADVLCEAAAAAAAQMVSAPAPSSGRSGAALSTAAAAGAADDDSDGELVEEI